MSKKIACVLTDMFEDVEYIDPAKSYKEAGHEVVTIGFEKGLTVEGKQGKEKVNIQKGIDEVSPDEFDALFIPGGFSPDILRADDRFVSFAKSFMDDMKPVFAICHGPQLLITAKTLEGRGVAGYKSIAVDIENAGATFKDQEVFVCKDQLVTSRQPDDIPAFNRESLAVLSK